MPGAGVWYVLRRGRCSLQFELEVVIAQHATHGRGWKTWALAGVVLALAVAGTAVALYFNVLTVPATVDGRSVRLQRGATVSSLFSAKVVERRNGDLVSAKDRHVLRVGKGEAPLVQVDGAAAASGTVVPRHAVIVTRDGADVVEPTKTRSVDIEMPLQYVGTGPIHTVEATGSTGTMSVRYGSISKQVVKETVMIPPVTRVIRLSQPTAATKMIALTFDDGPWPTQTKQIVRILQKNGVVATFFQIGQQAKSSPEISRMVAEAGMAVENHSETHANLKTLSASGVASQIDRAQKDLAKASGKQPTYFRPPGGNVNTAMYPVLARNGMKWVQWDVDTEDWKRPAAATITARVLKGAKPGAVVLMHDGGGNRSNTVAALPGIIAKLKAQGYHFVTLDALKKLPHTMG